MNLLRRIRIRMRGGTLMMIAAMMLGSAALRLGAATVPAAASPGGDSDRAAHADSSATDAHLHPAESPDATDAELGDLVVALKRRSAELDARETRIEDRMKAVAVADAALDRKLKALVDAEEKLRATLAMADRAAEGDLARLTEVYESMKPKESATLFQEMDPAFAAGFLGRMRPEVAAAVLAGMDPPAAYAISVILAGRNARVPTE